MNVSPRRKRIRRFVPIIVMAFATVWKGAVVESPLFESLPIAAT